MPKAGRLSNAEKIFIDNNIADKGVDYVCKYLKREPDAIVKYAEDNNLLLQSGAIVDNITEDMIERELKSRFFYSDLRKQLSKEELRSFVEHWTKLIFQFGGDILPSEELDVKEYINIEILKNRVLLSEKEYKDLKDQEFSKLQVYNKRDPATYSKEDKSEMRDLRAQIKVYTEEITNCRKEYVSLIDKGDKVKKSVADSRSKRAYDFDKAKIDITSLIKLLEDKINADKLARESEILKKAKDKEEKKMGEYYEFEDGKVDRLITNVRTIKTDD